MKRTLVVRVANCAAVSAPRNADHCAIMALTKSGAFGVPDVVLFSEVSPVNLARLAMIHAVGSDVLQYGQSGSPEAGVGIVSRLPIKKSHRVVGSPRTSEGGGIRMRPIVTGRVRGLPLSAVHAPPPRSPVARALYLGRVRATRGVIGGDMNQPAGWMRRHFGRKYRGNGVLGVLVPRRIRVTRAREVSIGSDHPAVDVEVSW